MNKMKSVIGCGLIILSAAVMNPMQTDSASDPDAVSSASDAVSYTAEDVQNLQDYILGKTVPADLTGKPYDLNGDGCWDSFDLCMMRSEAAKNTDITSGGDTIIVYFSRTGNTEKIAGHLIDITGAESYVISAAVPYTDEDIAYNNSSCRANQEQNDKTVRPEIASPLESLESYDTIFLGYPIWWGEEPRIIDTFLESYDFSEKTVIPFCTSASSGISASERNIAALVPIGEQLPGKRFSAGASREDVEAWYDSLQIKKEK